MKRIFAALLLTLVTPQVTHAAETDSLSGIYIYTHASDVLELSIIEKRDGSLHTTLRKFVSGKVTRDTVIGARDGAMVMIGGIVCVADNHEIDCKVPGGHAIFHRSNTTAFSEAIAKSITGE